ncbi:uncharacterized protein LOC131675565 [Phymastichus coffea]|uniref:uncharacterized protein LOC131675565 n=1 Tax=Phymastichus coffea TaxID=108790 RepID=UPI00273CBA85|nr:uncharacterized protein LOC131675565 [Phymastichus coffea]
MRRLCRRSQLELSSGYCIYLSQMSYNNSNASEAPGVGAVRRRANPAVQAPAVGEFNPNGRTTERWPIMEKSIHKIGVPFGAPTSCPECLKAGSARLYIKPQELARHIDEQHLNAKAKWECSRCAAVFDRCHGWIVHWSRCKGTSEQESIVYAFRCTVCEKSFKTKSDLSQHERHEHSELHNAKRVAEASKDHKPKGAPKSKWSNREIRRLYRLNAVYKDRPYPNKAIEDHMPSKTNRQIGEKRRELDKVVAEMKRQGTWYERKGSKTEWVDSDDESEGAVGPSQVLQEIPPVNLVPLRPQINHEEDIAIDSCSEEQLPMPSRTRDEVVVASESDDADHSVPSIDAIDDVQPSDDSSVTEEFFDTVEMLSDVEVLEEPTEWVEALRGKILSVEQVSPSWELIVSKIKELSASRIIASDEIDALYDSIEKNLMPKDSVDPTKERRQNSCRRKVSNRRRHHGRRRANAKTRPNRTDKRRYAYSRCQDLYDNDPKKLADIVVQNDFSLLQKEKPPASVAVKELYSRLWDVTGPVNVDQIYLPTRIEAATPMECIFVPITDLEMTKKLKSTNNSIAAGPDGITKSELMKKGVAIVLAKFFNLLLLSRRYPKAWSRNRTTLIPKAGKDLAEVKNWRPITISSLNSRLFSSMLDRRIRSVITKTDRQRGFIDENGCYANVNILGAAIQLVKTKGATFSVDDVAKAFDTVPHSAIVPALMRKGIHRRAAEYIGSMYEECFTEIKTDGEPVKIKLRRGVKQGDPISPLLFCLCIEPLVDKI